MTVPKQRHTKSRRNKRRGNIFIRPLVLAKCTKCGKQVLPHTICFNCGYYKGKAIIDVFKKLNKKEQKAKAKEISVKGEKDKSAAWEESNKK